jgi:hypothetical protein
MHQQQSGAAEYRDKGGDDHRIQLADTVERQKVEHAVQRAADDVSQDDRNDRKQDATRKTCPKQLFHARFLPAKNDSDFHLPNTLPLLTNLYVIARRKFHAFAKHFIRFDKWRAG